MTVDTALATTRSPAQLALTVGALGVVFADIGTSPIYTVQTIFNPLSRARENGSAPRQCRNISAKSSAKDLPHIAAHYVR